MRIRICICIRHNVECGQYANMLCNVNCMLYIVPGVLGMRVLISVLACVYGAKQSQSSRRGPSPWPRAASPTPAYLKMLP